MHYMPARSQALTELFLRHFIISTWQVRKLELTGCSPPSSGQPEKATELGAEGQTSSKAPALHLHLRQLASTPHLACLWQRPSPGA